MATLYKNGTRQGMYTRYVMQPNGTRLGYIFDARSNGRILVRPARAGSRWRVFKYKKDRSSLLNISMTIDPFLRTQLDDCFN